MNSQTRAVVLSILVITSVGLAGCTDGWGEDGPADSNTDEQEPSNNSTANTTTTSDTNTTANTTGDQQDDSSDDSTNERDDSSPNTADAADPTADTETDASAGGSSGESDTDTDTDTDADTGTQSSDSSADSESDAGSVSNDASDTESESESESESGSDTDTDSDSSSESDSSSGDDTSDSTDDTDSGSSDDSDEQSNTDEREVYTLTVHAGPGGSMAGIPVTIERHADGATTTRETNENGVVEFSVYAGGYTVSGTDPAGNTDEQDLSVGQDEELTLVQLEPETTAQFADSENVEVASTEHDTATDGLEVDTVTLVNTHEELPVSIANWRIKTQADVPTQSLSGGTELAPGEERTIQLRSDALHPQGDVLTLYDSNLEYVGQYSYAGSPGAPPDSGTNSNSNETSSSNGTSNESTNETTNETQNSTLNESAAA